MNKRSTSYAKKQNLLRQHEQIYFNINERQILNTNDVRGTFPKEEGYANESGLFERLQISIR